MNKRGILDTLDLRINNKEFYKSLSNVDKIAIRATSDMFSMITVEAKEKIAEEMVKCVSEFLNYESKNLRK